MDSKTLLTILLLPLHTVVSQNWYGHDYWNDRHGDEGINYAAERFYLWSDMPSVQDNYFQDANFYTEKKCSGGCSCGKELIGCSGTVVEVKGQNVERLTEKSFLTGVQEVHLIDMPNLVDVENITFYKTTNLRLLQIYGTGIRLVPDISKTSMQELYLVNNKIRFFPHNYTKQTLPTQLQKVSLIGNEIEWFPDEFVKNTNIEVLALSRNKIRQFPGSGLAQMPYLWFLSMNENELEVVSRQHLTNLQNSPLRHLNLSNNAIWYIEPGALSLLTSLQILELHANSFSEIHEGTFNNLPELVHLDLVKNKIEVLTARSITNLPKIVTIRVHSQDPPLNNIQFNAFSNIHDTLEKLWISDNALPTFPHPALSADTYASIEEIYADSNKIKSPTEYSPDDFPKSMLNTALQRAAAHVPFKSLSNLKKLHLGTNSIDFIQAGYFCNAKNLVYLYMNNNGLKDSSIPDDAFSCMGQLVELYLHYNLLTYVPKAVTSDILTKLTLLRLSNNNITHVAAGTFTNLMALQLLYLENNNIVVVENNSFPNSIRSLVLQANNFRFTNENPFSYLTNMEQLLLGYNSIVDIPDTAFRGCTALTMLDLHYNKLERIQRGLLSDCPLTVRLLLHNNNIRYVEDGTLSHITNTVLLHLHNNRLTELPNGGDFNNLEVNELFLHNNRITEVRPGTFTNLTCNVKLDLSENQIALLGPNAFVNIKGTPDMTLNNNPLWVIEPYAFRDLALQDLFLQFININHLKTATFENIETRYLYLTENTIDYVEEGIFAGKNVLEYFVMFSVQLKAIYGKMFSDTSQVKSAFDLRNNNLQMLPPDLVENVQVALVSLAYNKLTNFPRDIFLENKMTYMDISYNLISALPDDAFDGLTNMYDINLKGNQLTEIKNGSFTSLINTNKLDLSENDIVTWPKGLMDPMVNLKTLDLSKNLLYHFPGAKNGSVLSSIVLSDNLLTSIEVGAFDYLNKTLTNIDLTNNAFVCTCDLYRTLAEVYTVVKGGSCSQPNVTAGVQLGISFEKDSQYFKKGDKEKYICAPTNVRGTVDGNSVNVTWTRPLYQNSEMEKDKKLLSNDTVVSYTATCTGSKGDILTTDTNGTSVVMTVKPDSEYVCAVTASVDGTASGYSEPALLHTAATPATPENNTIVDVGLGLPIFYYDFSAIHPDFAGLSEGIIAEPRYISSPYGGWLAQSYNPAADSFSDWFLRKDGVNKELNGTITLENLSNSPPLYRYSAGSFFPVDDFGYGNEQKDCGGTTHNFGFTSVIRMGIVYQGTETITIGGGDDMWLYVNGKMVLYIPTRGTTSIICKKIDLSTAAQTGGATITPTQGTVSGGVCGSSTAVTAEAVHLDLEVGERYHFAVFHAERLLCNSGYFLELSGVQFITAAGEDPPLDYTVTIDEDFHNDGILATLILSDSFSVGPPFRVSILHGNEARHFSIKSDTAVNQAAGAPPAAATLTYTTIANISFVECATPSSIPADTIDTSVETFTVTAATALFTLAKPVDFELTDLYSVALEVVDYNKSPEQTGTIGIKIHIKDVNDNCPELDQSMFSIWANPALQATPIVDLNASDIDSGNNSVLRYYRSDVTATPPVSFNETEDLHKSVYTKNTTLSFEVFVVDEGVPRRGAKGTVTMVLDNSCLVSVEYEPIAFDFPLDEITGGIAFVAPGYYHYEFECLRVAGIEKAFIRDEFLTASSAQPESGPERARLNMTSLSAELGGLTGGWVAAVDDANQWIQTELEELYVIRVIQIQGREDDVNYVTTFCVYVSDDGITFSKYTDGAGLDVFNGAADQSTVVDVNLEPPARGKYIRINPQTWVGHVSLRFELIGCSQREELHYQTSCERCETTWYCPGDGSMLPCGRCEPPMSNSTCGRSPTEHSFGLASECAPCPLGWICKSGYAEPCEEFHYVTYCNDTYCPDKCTQCESGYACRGGQRYYCEVGTWSDGNKEFCELCRPGTYQDQPGQSSCTPCPNGFRSTTMKDRCEPCNPRSWSKGDGSDCEACSDSTQCPCIGTTGLCFHGVTCRNAQNPDGSYGHVCDPCPPGYNGDGVTCTDIDECVDYSPCWNASSCKNTEPGYQCRRCPIGYTGSFEDALAYNVTRRNFIDCNQKHDPSPIQHCKDTDECLTNNGGCDPNGYCHNTVGSFYCGLCKDGYIGSAKYGCELADYCLSGKHECNINATCVYAGPGDYSCLCHNGLAGNGFTCGPDLDLDGYPAEGISCNGEEFGNCKQDNCPDIPNSGQEDNDGDTRGDSCDDDDDNDTVFDLADNCPMVFNNKQEDADADGIGDACDNCPNDKNADQADADGDGQGDVCQVDSDGDGRSDAIDNCPYVANSGQADVDGDGKGDDCDNCPTVANAGQEDVNQNGIGDACENGDRDGDSIQDNVDNCPDIANSEQKDTDGDGTGDNCDDDSDNDGIADTVDNCIYVPNTNQDDVDGNHRGDDCENDMDQDGTMDRVDNCVENKFINFTSFMGYTAVEFYPGWSSEPVPDWRVLDQGREVRQEATTRRPIALIGPQALDHMDFYGTTFLEDDVCEGFIGLIFGYQSARKFYLITWRQNFKNFDYNGGMKGLQIRLVDAGFDVGLTLANALYHGDDVNDATRVIWHDPALRGWDCNMAYRWHIVHRPSIGLISVEIKQEENVVVDSGPVYDATILGGRLGVFVFDQKAPIWSKLEYQCKNRMNYALSLDGVDDYVTVGRLEDLGMEKSFTMEALIKLPAGYDATKHPILCTNNSVLCLYVEAGVLKGQVMATVITGVTTIPGDTWTHVALKYNAQMRELDLIVNGPKTTTDAQLTSVEPGLVWDGNTTLYIGYDGSTYLKGEVDEIRIYNLQMVELSASTEARHIQEEPFRYLLGAHYNMEGATSTSTVLKDKGYRGLDAVIVGQPAIVPSTSDQKVFDLTFN
ncbi:uncharacterized protein [Haliotis asinina]|uniref:uncharacterized protein n=1 Tax=Haliotis asinina TaxID=109174 RepID=UPI003531A7FC